MKINREACKTDGLTDAEMDFIEQYLETHPLDSTAALVKIGDQFRWVCRTLAEAIDLVRPGSWLRCSDDLTSGEGGR
jgi:hypothetical protein